MALVELRDVYKRYKMGEVVINAVDGISFTVEEGEFAVVVGTSGAGKTTVLNIIGGMDSATEGEVLVRGRDISRYSVRQLIEYRRHEIGFVFQFYNLVHNLTAKENVELAAQICKNPLDSEEALESVGLLERRDNFPAQLSGGEQQRRRADGRAGLQHGQADSGLAAGDLHPRENDSGAHYPQHRHHADGEPCDRNEKRQNRPRRIQPNPQIHLPDFMVIMQQSGYSCACGTIHGAANSCTEGAIHSRTNGSLKE